MKVVLRISLCLDVEDCYSTKGRSNLIRATLALAQQAILWNKGGEKTE